MNTERVCVVGSTGYAGFELVRLIRSHPGFELTMICDRKQPGTRLSELYPALFDNFDMELSYPDAPSIIAAADVVFLAVPHTAALQLVPELLAADKAVFDLSADYRLKDPAVYEQWYKTTHSSPELLEDAVYGLPEIYRNDLSHLAQVRSAKKGTLVAVPGCYPTATTLAAAPILASGIPIAGPVISDCISGVSGAGRTPGPRTHYCYANESVEAYGVGTHRHTPEIEQNLSEIAGHAVSVIFTPHLAPLSRGLLATVYLTLDAPCDEAQLAGYYEAFYGEEPLVSFLGAGKMPLTSSVFSTDRAQVGIKLVHKSSADVLVASCAIDNLGKGAAGQALQCANIVCGFKETEGLLYPAVFV